MRGILSVALIGPMIVIACALVLGQGTDEIENEPILYSKSIPNNAISRLQKQIDSGQVTLVFSPMQGYLPAVLKALNIPVSSQILVFSKTSFQRDLISPKAPRALYFNENTYIGWVQGGRVVEVSTVDPQLGAVFYTLPQEPQARPQFARQTYECLQCHSGAMSSGVPGHVMRSVYARPDGQPELRAGSYLTTDESPIRERWGGWYVTGTHGRMRHMGNAIAHGEDMNSLLDAESGANLTTLNSLLDTSPYLSRYSDIVALMAIEHQTHVQNLITRANYQTRMALQYESMLNKELNRPAGYRSDSTLSRMKSACDPLVKAMLFCGEEKLTDPIKGTSGFAQQFSSQGPRDKNGRSLRELDLHTRLLRYPCSWIIYSEAFDALPDLARDYVYRRLWDVLSGKDQSPEFAHVTPAERAGILEILVETQPSFAAAKPN